MPMVPRHKCSQIAHAHKIIFKRKNEIIKLSSKRMELENEDPPEQDKTDPKRQAWYVFSFGWMLALTLSIGMLRRLCIE